MYLLMNNNAPFVQTIIKLLWSVFEWSEMSVHKLPMYIFISLNQYKQHYLAPKSNKKNIFCVDVCILNTCETNSPF